MNRYMASVLGAALLLLGLGVPATAARPEATGPACADIDDGFGYTADQDGNGSWTLTFELVPIAPSCAKVTYTVYVLESGTDLTPLASQSMPGNGTTSLIYTFLDVDNDDTVCVYATTGIGGAIFDRAPDSGCMEVSPSSAGGQFK